MRSRFLVPGFVILLSAVIPAAHAQFTPSGQQITLHGSTLAVADVNGDGLDDIIEGSNCCEPTKIRLNLGGGKFGAPLTPLPGTANPPQYARVIDAADVNGDGFADLFTVMPAAAVLPSVSQPAPEKGFRLYIGKGDGTFTDAGILPMTTSGQIGVADFDADGKADVIAFENDTRNDLPCPVAFYHSNGDGTFTLTDRVQMPGPYNGSEPQTGDGGVLLAVGDVNNDGIRDVVVRSWDHIVVFLGKGAGKFDVVSRYFPSNIVPQGLDIVDVDGDGNADLAFMSNFTFRVLYGDGAGHFPRVASFYPGGQEAEANQGDYAVGRFTVNQPQVLSSTPDGTLVIATPRPDGTFQEVSRFSTGVHFYVHAYAGRFAQHDKRDFFVVGYQQPVHGGEFVGQAFLAPALAVPARKHKAASSGPRHPRQGPETAVENFQVAMSDECSSYSETWSLAIDGAFRSDAAPKAGRILEAAAFDGVHYFKVTPDGTQASVPLLMGNFTQAASSSTFLATAWGQDSCRGWVNFTHVTINN